MAAVTALECASQKFLYSRNIVKTPHPRSTRPPTVTGGAPIRTFQLRQGRISNRHSGAMARWWTVYGLPENETFEQESVFGRRAPLVLEIGSGMGDATIEMAAADPERDYVAVEVHTPGIANLLHLIADHELSNVRVFNGDALEFVRTLPEDSLTAVHAFFPDPWPKTRHHKRRLIQTGHVAILGSRLMPGGVLHCATDWAAYAESMLEVLSADTNLINAFEGYAPRPEHRPVTKFEQRGIDAGREIFDLVFRHI
ncbi:MAG: tRNA (guanosine(46)-N7)-methyltransferase TrmB [Longispora sp.]|nr:tRNA (guanosine(46)-N7)-methyltransferase TrmB [Longispora sp. (in: high G+C Gram-positive bacteria)]